MFCLQTACVSAWLTVSVAVERYICVCHATRVRTLCTVLRSVLVTSLVYVSMSLVALPSAFRYRANSQQHNDRYPTNCSSASSDLGDDVVQLTKLGRSEPFATVYYMWTLSLVRSIVPLFVLVALNSRIVWSLQTRRVPGDDFPRRERAPTAAAAAAPTAARRRSTAAAKNRDITVTLVVVILVFVVCIIPDAVMSACFGFGYVDERNVDAKAARELTDALLALSSAVNFVVYCLCSRQFRAVLLDVVSRRRVQSSTTARMASSSSSTVRRRLLSKPDTAASDVVARPPLSIEEYATSLLQARQTTELNELSAISSSRISVAL